MAIVSTGYDGTIDEGAWALMASAVGSSEYGVLGFGDWKVSIVAGQDRTVSIAAGSGWGKGVYDTSSSVETIQLDVIASGTRWDMIVMHRDWSGAGGVSSFNAIKGSSSKSLPTRAQNPGTLDDQPIALVQVTGGKTAPTAVVDLRCWGGNGGMTANDPLVFGYLTRPGGQLTIGTHIYSNTGATAGGTPTWREIANMNGINLFGVGGAVPGNPSPPATGNGFLMQAGSAVVTTDANGFAKINWPVPFPNGCLVAQVQSGDDNAWQGMVLAAAGRSWGTSPINKTSGVFVPRQNTSASTIDVTLPGNKIRLNYIAIGW